MKKVLIIEDELAIARFLTLELEHEGFSVFVCANGREGLEEAIKNHYDIIILDVMLPEMNGIEVLRRLRVEKQTPVIILTARDQVVDKVEGLDLGANDYMTKPFEIEELFARMRRLLKDSTGTLEYCGLIVDQQAARVSFGAEVVDLTKKEYELLIFLLKNKGKVVSREQVLSTVWGYQYIGNTNVVDVFVRYIRQKIDSRFNIETVQTVRGRGYIIRG